MMRFLSIGIDCISSLPFAIPAVMILQYAVFKKRNGKHLIAILLFSFYATAVFSIVGVPTAGTFTVDFGYHLVPLIDILNSPLDYLKNTILNMILFLPLGIFVPAVWKEYRSIKTVFFLGLALSASIELLQIFTFRLTDVDDLMTNTAGAVLGYSIGRRFPFPLPFRLDDFTSDDREGSLTRYEPFLILAVTLLIRIFLQPVVSGGIWDLVLSSDFSL